MVKAAFDLKRLNENDRIKLIGESVMKAPASSADKPRMDCFFVETEVKADRYIRKLKKRFPTIRIIDRKPSGPPPSVVMVTIGPPLR